METHIIRHYPYCKSQTKNIEYPNRTNKNNVNIIKELSKDEEYNDNYKKWLYGINYKSKTKNKIKIGGNLHMKLGKKFILEHIVNHTKCYTDACDLTYYSYSKKDILFDNVNSIDWDKYFLETEQIYSDIDIKNDIINENNKKIIEHNKKVNEIIDKINLLETWEQYIDFEGINYGIPYIYNCIHRENNCFGNIILDYIKKCQCSSCENWGGCGSDGILYYKCDKCDKKCI